MVNGINGRNDLDSPVGGRGRKLQGKERMLVDLLDH